MKRFLNLLLVFCLLLALLSVSTFAANNSYYLDELGMSIDIPDEFVVFTRDTKSDDPNLGVYGLTKQDLDFMYERQVYLFAWDNANQYELIVTMAESLLGDLSTLSDTLLNGLSAQIAEEYERNGITFIKSDIYNHSQTKFMKIYMSQPDNSDTVYSLQYHTIINGRAINITLHSYSGQIELAEEAILGEIIDGVSFDSSPLSYPTPVETAAFTYTDKTSGLSFTVPANWVEAPMTEEREFIDAKFASNLEDGLIIIYSSEDIYDESSLSEAEKLLAPREAMGNDIFTTADIAEMYGCEEKDISMVNYGSKEYYFAEIVFSGSAYGISVSSPIVCLVRCENGYMYMFQFGGPSDSVYFKDFVSLVSSAEYPVFQDAVSEDIRYMIIGSIALLIFILIAALYPLPIIIYRCAVKKRPTDKKKAKRISLIYGLCVIAAVILIIFFLGVGWGLCAIILLLTWVNYRILISGRAKEEDPAHSLRAEEYISSNGSCTPDVEEWTNPTVEEDPVSESFSPVFCHMCGNKLASGSMFCNNCGTKIPVKEDK